jgi:hypothetical protein
MGLIPANRQSRNIRYVGAILASCFAAVLIYGTQNMAIQGPLSDTIETLSALIAAGVAIYVARRYGVKAKISWCFVPFAVGLSLWFVAEIVWTVYRDLLGVAVPYPSVADVFWLSGYPAIILALGAYYRLFAQTTSVKRLLVAAAVSFVFVLLVVAVVIVPSVSLSLDPSTLIVDVAYPVLDVVMLFVSLMLLMLMNGGGLGVMWYIFAVACILEAVGDMTFSYVTATGMGGASLLNLLNLMYIYAYVLFALGLYEHRAML